ncbi:MAG: PAS-domain containing protein [Pseudomonadota bacterium]|nr:PAS-domain containing protein [Pseudomonadota bacterium]
MFQRLPAFLKNLSLRAAIALALTLGLAVPAVVTMLFTLTERRSVLLERLAADHDRIVEVLALGMQTPLWEIRPEAGQSLVEAVMLDERVTAIRVSSPLLPRFLEAEQPQRRRGATRYRESAILHDGEEIGRVGVEMDSGRVEAQLTGQWAQIALVGLAQFATGMVIIFALLRFKVIHPLQRLVQQTEALAAGDLDQPLRWGRADELGVLGRSFEETRRSLRELFADQERRTQELKKRRAELAGQAAVLRAILDNMTDGITLVDERLRLVAWNNRFLEIMGVARDSLREGMAVEELAALNASRGRIGAASREAVVNTVRKSFQPERPYAIQIRMADGRWIDVRRRPVPGGGFVSTYTDVTAQMEAQRKAEESRQLLEAVMDAVPALILVKDRHLRYRMVNRQFLTYWGFSREAVLGRTASDLFPPPVSRRVAIHDRQVLKTGQPVPFYELPVGRDKADPRTLWSTQVPLLDGGGRVTHIVTVDLDITERKRAEQERQRWLRLFHDAIESIPNGFAVYDASRRLVICNSAFAALYGVDPDTLTGATAADILQRAVKLMATVDGRPPETDRDLASDSYWSATGDPIEVHLKDGRWLLVSRHPTAEGGMVLVRTDITRLKQMEQALRDSEQRFRTIAETHPVPSIMVSPRDHRLIYASPGFMALCGASLEDIVSRPAEDFYAGPEDRQRLSDRLAAAGSVESYEMLMRRPDGRQVPVSVSARPVTYQGERVILASIQDLTERRKAEAELVRHREALHQSEKLSALGSLLAGVAHELNNPLSVVVGRAIMLEEQLRDTPHAKAVGKVRAAAERCARIVKTFLAMARQQEPRRLAVRLLDVVKAALDLVGYGLKEHGVEVELDIPPDLPQIQADPDQLTQVFTNLFVNAQYAMARHTPPRRLTVTARLDAAGQRLCIRVADTGPGIPGDILPRIFEPFFTTKPMGEGTGLGLSVSHGIVQSHGGTLTAAQPEGGGSAFDIALPIASPAVATEATPAAVPGPSRRILIVDDAADVADTLGEILAAAGHRIDTAGNGRSALDRLAADRYDLILCDLRMPDLDGPGLYARLRDLHPELVRRLIFITGDTLSDSARRFLQRARRPVLEKPFIPDEVRRLVNRTLGK